GGVRGVGVVRRDVEPQRGGVDVVARGVAGGRGAGRAHRRGQDVERDLDLEVVRAALVGALVVEDRAGDDLHAGGVGAARDGVGQRPRRVALVVVGVAAPAGAVDAVAGAAGGVVGVGEHADLEGRGRVDGVPAGIEEDLDRVGEPVGPAALGGDGEALGVVDDVDEQVQVLAD